MARQEHIQPVQDNIRQDKTSQSKTQYKIISCNARQDDIIQYKTMQYNTRHDKTKQDKPTQYNTL